MDRGYFSIEVILLLYSYKINYPKSVFFLRGNHECRNMTSHMNFRMECLAKYDQELYNIMMDSFDNMPLACIINNKFLAVHGGISPEMKTVGSTKPQVDRINEIDRFREPPRKGIIW